MIRKRRVLPGAAVAVMLWLSACGNLDVDPHLPGPGDVLDTPDELMEASATLYRDWFNAAHAVKGPYLMLATAADRLTTTEDLAAARDMALEPRQPFNNDSDYPYMYVTEDFWRTSYQVVLLANDILRAMEDKEKIYYEQQDVKPMLTAWAYFIRGIGYGYLGLLFDQANIVDVHSPLPVLEFSDYRKVVAFAERSLDTAIVVAGSHSFELPASFLNGVTMDAGGLAALAASYEARLLASWPRNGADMQFVNWQKILQRSQEGVTTGFYPVTDNDIWRDEARQYLISPRWGGLDLRVIHLLDDRFPAHWPADNSSWETPDGTAPDSSYLRSNDARAVTDIEWLAEDHVGTPYYLNTFYRLKRYDEWAPDASGPVPELTVTENLLLQAEALVHTGRSAEAVALLNNGTRVSRGHLPPLNSEAAEKEVLDAIFYEREMELTATGLGLSFFDMRRRDLLQKGTPLHLPVPGKELEIMGLPVYTYGGVDNADGLNTSAGGWEEPEQ